MTPSVPNFAPLRRGLSRATPELLNIVLITLGILSASMGLHGFLLSSNFIDGGVTGVSMLASKVSSISLSIWLPVFNLPFIALGYRQIGPAFAIRSAAAIAGLSIALATLHFPDVTHDLVLTAVFGGFFIGAGIGLAVRGGAVLDGTEIAALLISKRSHLLKVGDVILLFNVVLFVLAMRLLGVEEALYSILTYVAAARTLDFVIHGIEEFTAITIVSRMSGEIGAHILAYLGPRRDRLQGPRRPERRGSGDPVLRGHAAGDRQSEIDRPPPRSRRVRDDACVGGCGWGDGEADAALIRSPQPGP